MQLPLLLRAIITGFGYKLGAELGKWVVEQVDKRRKAKAGEAAEDDLDGLSPDASPPVVDPPASG
jgi:hypothetical protein